MARQHRLRGGWDVDDRNARAAGRGESQRNRPDSGGVRTRAVAASEQLGSLGGGVRRGRLRGARAGLARRPRDRRRGECQPGRVRQQDRRRRRRPLRGGDRQARSQAGRDRPLVRRPAGADPGRAGTVDRHGGDRSGAVSRRAAAADLGAALGQPGAQQPGQPPPRRAAHLRAVPLRVRECRQRGRGQEALRRICRARPRRSAVPGRDRQLQPVDGGEGRPQEPRARPAADHLRREGSHRALGDRERLASRSRRRTRASPRSSRSAGAATRSRSTAAGARWPTRPWSSSGGSHEAECPQPADRHGRQHPPRRGDRQRGGRRERPAHGLVDHGRGGRRAGPDGGQRGDRRGQGLGRDAGGGRD